jgi:hypothetical protein
MSESRAFVFLCFFVAVERCKSTTGQLDAKH